ncbi:hypothetical protein ETAA8_61190 [Anatilimnocola aggregata]|uniref:Squalene cyclase C-terminal domain-containing protein n=1 Tax=Anatilimnocola aggregata TaxID=2528021 RepID=A0A517YL56_9BACT|nr:hypothetical protein [Anatilimnocola aggregata]QDU30966.1 hypothetical protein ETAA8_61190 [Anatilimnocola aggregata]
MDDWLQTVLDDLAKSSACGYLPQQTAATEPSVLAALALNGHGRTEAAQAVLDYLARAQQTDGSVGVRATEATPGWPTSLAVIAWQLFAADQHQGRIARGMKWISGMHGETLERSPEMGHNTLLDGWPWAAGTHSWLEPTAFHLLAYRAVKQRSHPRAAEAVRLLIDRQLPDGGCNYGNTTVLGQTLRPHVQPTGIALLALAGESDPSGRMEKSLTWLKWSLGSRTTASSLSWALHGLHAHGREVPQAAELLRGAYQRVQSHDQSPHKFALLALAALGEQSPLIGITRMDTPA